MTDHSSPLHEEKESHRTVRATVSALEDILYKPFPVLDHGFVRVIDYMGNDSAIVQAARVSYGKGTKQVNQDRGLIQYLMRHRHSTPFEMCEIKFHIKLPIFVARQWVRHRTANINEASARYSVMDQEFYLPEIDTLRVQSSTNHQGRGEKPIDSERAQALIDRLKEDSLQAHRHYRECLQLDEEGVPVSSDVEALSREIARIHLPVNYYTQWYWKIDLHNLLHFLSLRADSHAQYEIRAYAEVIQNIVQQWVPLTFEAFTLYRRGSASLSSQGLKVVKALIAGKPVHRKEFGLGEREWRELEALLEISLG